MAAPRTPWGTYGLYFLVLVLLGFVM
jgi:hypothetical protein